MNMTPWNGHTLCLASFEPTSLVVCDHSGWQFISTIDYLKSFAADLTVHPCFVWSMAVVGRGAPWFLWSDCRKRTASVVEKKDAIGKLSEASMGSWGRISMDSPCQSLPWPLAALRSMTFQRHHDVNGPIFFHDTWQISSSRASQWKSEVIKIWRCPKPWVPLVVIHF